MRNKIHHILFFVGLLLVFSAVFSANNFLKAQVVSNFSSAFSSGNSAGGLDSSLDSIPRLPSCGSAHGKTYTSVPPSDSLCESPNVLKEAPQKSGSIWTWKCKNSLNSSISCEAIAKDESQPSLIPATPASNLTNTATTGFSTSTSTSNTSSGSSNSPTITNSTSGGSSTSTASSGIKPSGKIMNPKSGVTVINKSLLFSAVTSNATKVEFNATREGASSSLYLGSASKIYEGFWKLTKSGSDFLPNGSYKVIATISNQEGSINSDPVDFQIALPSDKAVKEDQFQASLNNSGNSGNNTEDIDSAKTEEQRLAEVDSDGDGLTDQDEARIGTDSRNPDTDGDGYLDGDEIKNGFDPLRAAEGKGSKSDKIMFQSPKEKGDLNSTYKVDLVTSLSPEDTGSNQQKIKLNGKGLPNSFVTVYIYSNDPVIITVKTNANGDWEYVLDKNLEDGDHEAYVAVTDNTGKITSKSEPLFFVKTAQAVEMKNSNTAGRMIPQNQSPVERSQNNFVIFSIIIIIFCIGAAAMVAAVILKKRTSSIY